MITTILPRMFNALNDTQASLMSLFEAKTGCHGVLVYFLHSGVQSNEELVPIRLI